MTEKSSLDTYNAQDEQYHDLNRSEIDAFRMVLRRLDNDARVINASAIASRVMDGISVGPVQPKAQTRFIGHWKMMPQLIVAAAAVFSVVVGIRTFTGKSLANSDNIALVSYYSSGRVADVALADGSTIKLTPQTKIDVSISPRSSKRNVKLDGEAYFSVVTDPSAPFTVEIADETIRVLGTSFGVRSRADEGAIQVAVQDGRVSVGESTILDAGMVYNRIGIASPTVSRTGTALMNSWIHGNLKYDSTALAIVLKDIKRWYGTELIEGQVFDQSTQITASIPTDNSQTAIKIIEAITGLRFR